MSTLFSDQSRVLLLVIGCATLYSLESVIPLYRFGDHRLRRTFPNVALTLLLFLTNLALSFVVASVAAFAIRHRVGLLFRIELPVWMELVAGVVALDLFGYLAHVSLHRSRLLWRFHRVHHSDEHVDVTTAFRQHPGETIWRISWQLPPILLLGLPLWVVAVYLTISAANAQLEHANLRVRERVDRLLRLALVTPNMHKVHHSRVQPETDSNYSNIFSMWDRLFGTYTAAVDFKTLQYGLDDLEDHSPRLRRLLAMPFVRARPRSGTA